MKDLKDYQEVLDKLHTFPGVYLFKFIAPTHQLGNLKALFPEQKITVRPSKKGNYFGVTIKMVLGSSEEVIRYYEQAAQLEGIITL